LIAIKQEWVAELGALFGSLENGKSITFIGLGNPIKSDDSVGLQIISKLRKELGAKPKKFIRIDSGRASPEVAISRVEKKTEGETIVLFDAVETNSVPGSIIFANLEKSKFGFFATHNIPLKLVPTITAHLSSIFVVGIQPGNTEIGESLSQPVRESMDWVIETVTKMIREVP
jgi:hydrogenase maturation protease